MMLGNGLLVSQGDLHKSQRKIISQIFNFRFLNSIFQEINKLACQTVGSICEKKLITPYQEIKKYAQRTIIQFFLGVEFDNIKIRGMPIRQIVDKLMIFFTKKLRSYQNFLIGSKLIKLRLRKQDRQMLQLYDELKTELISIFSSQKFQNNQSISIVKLLIKKYKEGSDTLDFGIIVDQFMTFFLAGTQTTSSFLEFSLFHLSKHPEIQEKLRKQANQAQISNLSDLNKLPYLNAFIKEVHRATNPVVVYFPLKAIKDNYVLDLLVEKGTSIIIPIQLIHYNPLIYQDPLEFKPERFIDRTYDAFQLIPFSSGQRNCIGQHLAGIQSRLFLLEFVKNVKSSVNQGFVPKYLQTVINKFQSRLQLNLTKC